MSLARRAAAEAVGTAFLLAAVVGSGIMGERLSGGSVAIALLANSAATGAALVALILTLGAAMNPLVTVSEALRRVIPWHDVPGLVLAQLAGAVLGVLAANAMFELPAVSLSQHARSGGAQWLSESIATFGLLLVVIRAREPALAVGGYIAAAYWFTSSTSFANPAVTVARALTDTFAGIRPADVGGFVAAQLAGGAAATGFGIWLGGKR
ncbi:MAG TPA: aquaporin [Myxococcota bacterium]|nr:aquaporin [Myxococcota bacterium]